MDPFSEVYVFRCMLYPLANAFILPINTLSKLFQSLSAFLHTMSLRGKIVRLCQAGAAGGLVTALTVQLLDRDNRTSLGSKFLVNAKSRDFSQVNDLYQGMGVKWDSNWDHRHELTNYGILLII